MIPVLYTRFEKVFLLSLALASLSGAQPSTSATSTRSPALTQYHGQCQKEIGAGSWHAKDGCNLCWCVGSGVMACTDKKDCGVTCKTAEGLKQPGESWTAADGCNTCRCTSTGLAACTRRFCPEVTCKTNQGMKKKGDRWTAEDGCNTCRCMKNGLIRCTRRLCPEETCKTTQGLKKKGERWDAEDGCNTCRCMKNGLIRCTRKICHEPVCVLPDGQTKPKHAKWVADDGCNQCRCMKNGLVRCTNKKKCGDKVPVKPVQQVQPVQQGTECHSMQGTKKVGDKWTAADGCNRCICMKNGTVYCTEAILCHHSI